MKYIILLIILIACSNKKDSITSTDNKRIDIIKTNYDLAKDDKLEHIDVILPSKNINNKWHNSNIDINKLPENIKFNGKNNIINSKLYHGKYMDNYFKPSIVVDKQNIYSIVNNTIKSYNINNLNKELWSKKISNIIFPPGGVLYDDNKLFIANTGEVISISAIDGKELWRRTLGNIVRSDPSANNNMLFVLTIDNNLYALDKENGKTIWKHEGVEKDLSVFGKASPVVFDNMVIVPTSSGQVDALSLDGENIWSIDLSFGKTGIESPIFTNIDVTPVIKNNKLFITGNMGLLYAIDLYTGKLLWQKNINNARSFWVAMDYLYIIDDNMLYAINIENGGIKWINDLDITLNVNRRTKISKENVYYGPSIVNDELIIASELGHLIKISPYDGSLVSNKKICDRIIGFPIVTSDSIYLTCSKFLAIIK